MAGKNQPSFGFAKLSVNEVRMARIHPILIGMKSPEKEDCKLKKPPSFCYLQKFGGYSGPCWARTSDPLIMRHWIFV
jgi:hypothetical protein